MPKYVVLFVIFLMNSQLIAQAQSGLPAGVTPAKFHLYVLAGQSNMAGRGAVEPIDKTPHPRVWVLNRANQWVPATEPLHFDKPDVVGVGPGLAFGKLVAEQDTRVFIGLIPTAVGDRLLMPGNRVVFMNKQKTIPTTKRSNVCRWHNRSAHSTVSSGIREKATANPSWRPCMIKR